MTDLYRVRTVLSGFPGGPGIATMYSLDVATFVASLHTFWNDIAARVPSDFHAQVQNTGDIITDTTGELTGAWSASSVASVTGSDSAAYAAPAGAVVRWQTETILDGRRLRGRTFVVPLGGGGYQTDGSLASTYLGTLQTAATAFIASQSSSFVVWHRPFAGSPAVGARPARPAHDGGHGFVTTAIVPDMAAVLRSRRD